ncbi:MAG: hypothetical protein U0796_23670 [Gemmatales bacterium]
MLIAIPPVTAIVISMDNYTTLLTDLHTYLLRIRSTMEELDEAPKRLKRNQNKIAAAEKALADHQNAIKLIKVAMNDRDVSLKANSARIEKCKRDLNNIMSKKESDALTVEIASLEKKNNDLADEGLALMTQAEEMTARIPTFEQAIVKARADLAAAETEQQQQLPAWNARLAEAKALVAEKISQLPPEWLKIFKRVELHEGADALSPLNGRSCAACYTEVTAQQYAMIQSGQLEACKNCSKLLYMQAVPAA